MSNDTNVIEETEQVEERVLTPEQKKAHELDELRCEIRDMTYNQEAFILVLLQNPVIEKTIRDLNSKVKSVQGVLEERYNFRY